MTRPVDWQQREQAQDPERSWIVQAPAGSGKTELLTQRMLGLLAQAENPEEVIAITFTRKAAAEMRRRLVQRLQAAGKEPENLLEPHEETSRQLALATLRNDEARGWNLLQQPSRLRIRTIDSLCSELARQLPILSGLGGNHQVAEDAKPLYRLAAARTMAAIEDDRDELQADVIRVLDRYDNKYDRLVDLLTSMLGHREQWIGHLLSIKTEDGFDREGLEEALTLLIEEELRSAMEIFPDHLLAGLSACLVYALEHLPDDAAQPIRALIEASGGPGPGYLMLSDSAESLPQWVALVNMLLTQNGTWRAGGTVAIGFPAPSKAKGEEKDRRQHFKDQFKALLDSMGDNDELLDRFKVVRKLPRPDYDDESWESLESLMRLLIRASQEWKMVMSESGQTDFSEIASRAIQALGDEDQPSNLALKLDYRIEHLLVDEFQDTSLSQIRLLERLTAGWTPGDGRTLFLVGDPMQSIYRFRKAEVSLFIQAFEGGLFQHIDLEPLQLSVNFRSAKPVVEWVNTIFRDVMPKTSDPLKDAVHYSPSCARADAGSDGTVTLRITPQRDDEEEAQRVVDIISESDPEDNIAILVRSRKQAASILSQLDRLKSENPRYRYQAINFNPLAETPTVIDLAALTLALTQVADRLAWLAVLRSPCIGLDLSDLDALASADKTSVIPDLLEDSLRPDPESGLKLSADGNTRLLRAVPLLLNALERRGRDSTRTLVESTWTLLGGPACVSNESELADAATFLDLLDALEEENLPVDRDTLNLRMENLHAQPDATASDKLQVMTIFAAKGLEFGTVILPGMNRSTGNDNGKLLHWFELAGQDQIVMSPMRNAQEKERQKHEGDLIQFIADVEARRQSLENGRLLYVAATRAKNSLHLFGAIEPTKKGEFNVKSGTLLAELWPAIRREHLPGLEAAFIKLPEDSPSDDRAEAGSVLQTQPFLRLAADWQTPSPPGAIEQVNQEQPDIHDYIEFRWAGEDARLTGNLVHRLLQLIAEQGLDKWSTKGGMTLRQNWCRQQLARDGVTGKKAERIVERTSEAIAKCLASDRGRWMVGPREEAECEYALTAILDGQARNLVLDRSFVENGERWIIDYKSSSHSGGNLEGFLESEAERYSAQLQRYRDAMALTESRPIRIALYFPLLDRFLEL